MSDKKVDEDWKKRAQIEKEQDALKAAAAPSAPKEKTPAAAEPPKKKTAPARPGAADVFSGLVEQLAGQALLFMGALRDPMTGQTHRDLGQAQAVIDLLEVLDEKTRGNLTTEEAEHLAGVLDELRINFVRLSSPPPPKGPMMQNTGGRP